MDILLLALLLIAAYVWGSRGEKKHYADLARREAQLRPVPVINFDRKTFNHDVASVRLVQGGVVMGADYFKTVLSGIVSIFGGNIAAVESVLERGRREAVLRLKEQVPDADFIANLRYETSEISDQGSDGREKGMKVEIFCYATAIYLKK